MAAQIATGGAQFIIATHSPILLTFPGAHILSFDGDAARPVTIEDTSHYQITRGILQNPGVYWQHLRPRPDREDRPAKSRRQQRRGDDA